MRAAEGYSNLEGRVACGDGRGLKTFFGYDPGGASYLSLDCRGWDAEE